GMRQCSGCHRKRFDRRKPSMGFAGLSNLRTSFFARTSADAPTAKQVGRLVLTPGAGWHAFAAPLQPGLWLNAGQGPRKHATPFCQKILAYLVSRVGSWGSTVASAS